MNLWHSRFDAYWMLGVSYLHQFWDYWNALQDETGHTIAGDRLGGVNFYCGSGLQLRPSPRWIIGTDVRPGVTWYSEFTAEGFENDVFEGRPGITVNMGITLVEW
jgi:hypothetical protein